MQKQIDFEPLKTLILEKGFADDTVKQVISVLREHGYGTEVDCLIWDIENAMFAGELSEYL
jgi:hypothetical protein